MQNKLLKILLKKNKTKKPVSFLCRASTDSVNLCRASTDSVNISAH
jgi:hypothetical protein